MPKNSTKKKNATATPQKQLTVDDLLAHIVDVRPALGHKIIRFLLDNPEKIIMDIAKRLDNSKDSMYTAAQYALEGITLTALEPGNEKLCHDVAMAYMKAIMDENITPETTHICLNHVGRLQDPSTAELLLYLLPNGSELATAVVRTLRSIGGEQEWDENKIEVVSRKLKRLPANIRNRYCIALIEMGNKELVQKYLDAVCSKKSSKRNTLDLAILDAAAKNGFKSIFPCLIKMLQSNNKYEKGHAIQSLVELINYYAAKAENEGGFENYIQQFQDEDDCEDDNCDCEDDNCDCEDDNCDCEDDNCDCEDDDCDCGCHEHHHHDEQDDEDIEDEDYDCEEDFDFQACLMAKEFLAACPCVASLGALVRAYGETKDTAAITAAALANPDAKVRNFARKMLVHYFSNSIYDEYIYKLAIDSTNPEEKSGLLEILGARNVAQARPYLMSMLQDSNPILAQSAMKALFAMPGDDTLLQNTINVLNSQRNKTKKK